MQRCQYLIFSKDAPVSPFPSRRPKTRIKKFDSVDYHLSYLQVPIISTVLKGINDGLDSTAMAKCKHSTGFGLLASEAVGVNEAVDLGEQVVRGHAGDLVCIARSVISLQVILKFKEFSVLLGEDVAPGSIVSTLHRL